jgi:hypothetical protein
MVTVVSRTIGSGGFYSTMAGWEADAPSHLVSANVVWQGQLLNETFTASSGNSLLTMAGSIADATRYKELTCAPGASFMDHPNKATNPLRVNPAVGATITGGVFYGNGIITMEEGFSRVRGLQIQTTSTNNSMCLRMGRASDCILESSSLDSIQGTGIWFNCREANNVVFICRRNAADGALCVFESAAVVRNCTFVVPSDLTPAARFIRNSYGSGLTFQNCAFFGATSMINNAGSTVWTNCFTSLASPPSGCTTVAYDTTTGSGFVSTADASRDFRIKESSALRNAGITLADVPNDIVGTLRPQGLAYDVGAWEFGAAAAGSKNVRRGGPRLPNYLAM